MKNYSLEYEQALLGCLISDNTVIDGTRSQIKKDDFYSSENGNIYDGILRAYDKNRACDLMMLCSELPNIDVGVITGLCDKVPSALNYDFYVQKIKHLSMQRTALKICESYKSKISSATTPDGITETLAAMDRSISDNLERESVNSGQTIKQAITKFVNMVEDKSRFQRKYNGFETGFEKLDDIMDGLPEKELIVLGARPSIGKTAFAMNMAYNIAKSKKAGVCIFSLEMATQELMTRLVASETGISPYKLKHGMVAQSQTLLTKLQQCLSVMFDTPLSFYDAEKDSWTVAAIASQMRIEAKKGAKIFLIDHLGLIKSDSYDTERWRQVHEITWKLKQSAKALGVAVVLLCQLRRDAEGKPPVLSDLRESGDIEQDADIVLFLDRKRIEDDSVEKTDAKIIVAKNRNGACGFSPLYFYPSLTRFSDI